ncbi:MAG: enoyl-CoA hydratase-related protein [Actinomycetota bacterium]|nr:enoyl-CoA hydratase-related protein [Actinomycetota bacterium]
MGEFVTVQETDHDGVAVIRLDRPKVNALNTQVGHELLAAATEIETRSDIRAVVLWGGPRFFAAGADISEFPVNDGIRDPSGMVDALNAANFKLENLPQITIAAVNGFALGGGCELSMSTDFRICGEGAVFGQPEILLGLIAGAGGTQRLTRLIGITKAKELNYTGRNVKADEALAIGLVSAVHPDDQVLDQALELAARYAKGPAALANAKKAIMDGLHVSIEEAITVERSEFIASFQTDDAVIGIKSFLEQGPGKAAFTGR